MKILITGGAGFIGSNVVRLLEEKGIKTFVLDDFSFGSFKNLKESNCEVICGDILDQKIFNKLPKLEAVIHEAAVTDTTLKDDKKMLMINYEGFKSVLNFCLKKKIKFIYASSAGVYGDCSTVAKENQKLNPLNSYAYSKYLCDRYAQKVMKFYKNFLIVGLRYFNVYGPGEYHKKNAASMIYQLYMQMKENKRPRIFKFGEQRRDFIYIKDVATLTVEALNLKKSIIVNIGTGIARSFNEIINILNKNMDKKLEPEYFDNPFVGVYQNFTKADISLLKKTFNFLPKFSLETGIKDYIKNYLTNL